MSDLKMYIAIREEVPAHMVPVLVAHTVLGNEIAMRQVYNWNKLETYDTWRLESFKKCIVKVNRAEWAKIIQIPDVFLGHENSVMLGKKSCAIPPIMEEYPNVIKFAKLWKP